MNVKYYLTKGYENMSNWAICENEPKTNPIGKKMLPRITIKPRRKSLAHYTDFRFLAADHGPNLSCFAGLLFALGLIFSEKKQQIREIPDKAGAGLCRFVYIRKSLLLCQGQGIITVDFRLRIEDKHW